MGSLLGNASKELRPQCWAGGGELCPCSAQSCLWPGQCLPVGTFGGIAPSAGYPGLQKAFVGPPAVPPGPGFRGFYLIR